MSLKAKKKGPKMTNVRNGKLPVLQKCQIRLKEPKKIRKVWTKILIHVCEIRLDQQKCHQLNRHGRQKKKLPNPTLSEVASLLSQKPTQDRTTSKVQGR